MTDEPPITIASIRGYERITANQRQALYEKEQELERLRAENARLAAANEARVAYAEKRNMQTRAWMDEVNAMRPVVEAARAFYARYNGEPEPMRHARALFDAVATYEAAQSTPEKPHD